MADTPVQSGGLSLTELIALGDEIAALIRAGVPLEQGLAGLGRDMPGRVGQLTAGLAERMNRGESLSQALALEQAALPEPYVAVIEAGQAAGRLPAALESVSQTARRLADVQQAVTVALVYPLVVLVTSYTLAVGFLVYLSPYFHYVAFRFKPELGDRLYTLVQLGSTAAWWAPVLPLALAALIWWGSSGRGVLLGSGWRTSLWRFLPGIGALMNLSRVTTLCEILAMLVDSGVPLAQALGLAARASGDPAHLRAAQALASAAEQGAALDIALGREKSLPRFLVWIVSHGAHEGRLKESLRHAAAIYRERALWQADLVRHWGAIVLTMAIGGTSVVAFAMLLFLPFTSILESALSP